MVVLEHRNMETGAGFPACVAIGDGRVARNVLIGGRSVGSVRRDVGAGSASNLSKISLVLVLMALPGVAWGCEEPLKVNPKPRQSDQDCSFSGYGVTGQWSGRPVMDFGDGKVAQLVVSSESCPYLEKLHFVDCTTGLSVNINGVYEPSIQRSADNKEYLMLGGDLKIKYIQPPYGSVSISSQSTAKSVTAVARSAGYEWSSDILSDLRASNNDTLKWFEMGKQDSSLRPFYRYAKSQSAGLEFDAMCGCKRYYPESLGAKN
jgi:hypothetical protein